MKENCFSGVHDNFNFLIGDLGVFLGEVESAG